MPEEKAVDRNWNELLQELRVTQTGLQILTGFLVSIPFQQRFTGLSGTQQGVFMTALSVPLGATAAVLAPASFHRLLFRRREKEWLVRTGNVCARAGLILSAAISLVACLFDVVGRTAGIAAVVVAVVLFVGLWWGVPLVARGGSTVAGTPEHSPRS
jgi:Family of unknown function (DUF6328)